MNRLVRYIENELHRNAILFAQAETNMLAGLDFIELIMQDENFIKLTAQEKNYLNEMYHCYSNMQNHLEELKIEIQKYREIYIDFFADN